MGGGDARKGDATPLDLNYLPTPVGGGEEDKDAGGAGGEEEEGGGAGAESKAG